MRGGIIRLYSYSKGYLLFLCVYMYVACFGAWDLGPQHGFARISKWNCSESPTTVSQNYC